MPVFAVHAVFAGSTVLSVLTGSSILTVFAVGAVDAVLAILSVLAGCTVLAVFAVGTVLAVKAVCADFVAGLVEYEVAVEGPVPVAVRILANRDDGSLAVNAVLAVFAVGTVLTGNAVLSVLAVDAVFTGRAVLAVFAVGAVDAVLTVGTILAVADFHGRFHAGMVYKVYYTHSVALVFDTLYEEFAVHEVGEYLHVVVEFLHGDFELAYPVVEIVHGVPKVRVVVFTAYWQ